ncbi:MAG: nucleoside 2-deoxyribosyltransferase [Hahellaceae bacterium]|nr:nucleoside 2-deoxyribosyltransferase [Hahellaceae bacterium]
MPIKTLYLAGPDVFYPNAAEMGRQKQALCQSLGLVGLFPLDNEVSGLQGRDLSHRIYQGNLDFMRHADAIIANITPFRGPGMDPGTAFEVGFFAALQKPIFLYSNRAALYEHRVLAASAANGFSPRDEQGYLIESFGLADNLMIIEAAALPVECPPSDRPDTDQETFQRLLQRILAYPKTLNDTLLP